MICLNCQVEFNPDSVEFFGKTLTPSICMKCSDAVTARFAAEEKAERLAVRVAHFNEMCPPIYRSIDMTRAVNPAKTTLVAGWTYNPKGLVISGKPRSGKTRAAWALVRRQFVEEGRSVAALPADHLARLIGEAYGTSGAAGMELFEKLVGVHVLFIDDFGKFKVTARVEDELMAIIEHRTSHMRPIILTTNSDRTSLAAAFSPDRSVPMFDRLREFCAGVNFDKP